MSQMRRHRVFLYLASLGFAGLAIWSATSNRWDTCLYWTIFAFLFALQAWIEKTCYRTGYFEGRTELLYQISEGSARGMDGAEILHTIVDVDKVRARDRHWP